MFLKMNLRDSRGMTLVEVMMALAVFGIITLFITQMTGTSSRITAGNSEQVRMMELARAEAEKIKADPEHFPSDTNCIIAYPPGAAGGEIEETYAVMYRKEPSGKNTNVLLKITVGPVTDPTGDEPLDSNNPDNYVLVTWIPPKTGGQ